MSVTNVHTFIISLFSMSGAHAHWVGSLDTPSHATKGKKCAKGTGSISEPSTVH